MAVIKKLYAAPQVIWKLKSGWKTKTEQEIATRLGRGLSAAGLYLQRESQKIVPVQTGNLKNSAFTRRFGLGVKIDVIVGYTAVYAAFVHEDLTKAHGKEFNVKHAAELAHTGKLTKAGNWSPTLRAGTAAGGMFPRGENQQAKFLEKPAREQRLTLFKIIREVASL
jgi:hypothetical protein